LLPITGTPLLSPIPETPIVTPCPILQLFPIEAFEFKIIPPKCPI